MHHLWVGQHASYDLGNLKKFKGLCTCYGADFFQMKVDWKEEKIHKEAKDGEQEERKEGWSEEEGHGERKMFQLWYWWPLEMKLSCLPGDSEE